jgi:hypothetical protein
MPINPDDAHGAGGIGENPTKKLEDQPSQNKPDKSILERLAAAPSAMSKMFTGEEVPIEFPDLPELTEMGSDMPGLIDRMLPQMQALLVSDDVAKAEIFRDSFQEDPRYGGVFRDKYGHPMVVWNDAPYYINKPGATSQDFNVFFGELLKYIPAVKYVGGAKTIGQTIMRGIPSYATTETGSKVAESLIAPETVKAREQEFLDVGEDVATATGIGVGADIAVPVAAKVIVKPAVEAIKAGSRAVSKTAGKVAEAVLPEFSQEAIQSSKYPLTQGQRKAPPPQGVTPRTTEQLGVEDVMRQSPSSEVGTALIRGFDDVQLSQIRDDALELQEEFGAGTQGYQPNVYGGIPSVAAEQTQDLVSSAADRLKQQSGELYEAVSSVPKPPTMNADGVAQVAREVLDQVPLFGVTPGQIVNGPLKREMTALQRLIKLSQNPRFKDQALKNIHGYQKRLGRAIGQAADATEKGALTKMKMALDDAVFNGIERGFIEGEQEVLDQLKNATGLYADYMALMGRAGGRNKAERAANAVLETLSNNQYTPLQVTNLLFGHNKFAPNQSMPLVIDTLKKSLSPDEWMQTQALLKDGILTRAFAGGGAEITRTSIVKNFDSIFNQNRAIINKLFNPEEIARVKEFRQNVLPTLWAEVKANPSGTGYTMLGSFWRQGLLSFPSLSVRTIGSKVIKAADESERNMQAMDAVRQTVSRLQTPLLSGSAQATIRPLVREETDAETASPTPPLPDAEREKILQSMDQLQKNVAPPQAAAPQPSASPTLDLPVFEPLDTGPQTSDADSLSAIVLPRDEDRELAMRLRSRQPGIAGLV